MFTADGPSPDQVTLERQFPTVWSRHCGVLRAGRHARICESPLRVLDPVGGRVCNGLRDLRLRDGLRRVGTGRRARESCLTCCGYFALRTGALKVADREVAEPG